MPTLNSFSDIDSAVWQAFLQTLPHSDYPFFQYDFLALIEKHAANPSTGWTPKHQALFDGDQLVGFMPLYAKTHSRGEFVFDHAWAHAYQQHGLDYYPKLLNAIPFTPCPGARILGAASIQTSLIDQAKQLCLEQGYSGLHSLFTEPSNQATLKTTGFTARHDCAYRWKNHGYKEFNDYLMALRKDKRKKIRQERRKVEAAAVTTHWLNGDQIPADYWPALYQLYCSSYWMRGQQPYLSLEFFRAIAVAMPQQFLVCLALHNDSPIAAAFCYRDNTTLYGRHWGADNNYHSLHFELCYYQGIEYCIAHGLQEFDAGVQGEHKHARGFEATQTTSMHWIAHDGFRQAIADFLQREGGYVNEFIEQQKARSALKEPIDSNSHS